MVGLGASAQNLLPTDFSSVVVLIAHRVRPHIKSQADRLGRMLHVATSLHDILRGYLEGRRTIFLLEGSCEVTFVIILPLEESRDLVHKFRGLDTLTSLVHSTLVTALHRRVVLVVKEASTGVARLVGTLAADNVKDQGVTRDLLVHLNLDDVTTLDLRPI